MIVGTVLSRLPEIMSDGTGVDGCATGTPARAIHRRMAGSAAATSTAVPPPAE